MSYIPTVDKDGFGTYYVFIDDYPRGKVSVPLTSHLSNLLNGPPVWNIFRFNPKCRSKQTRVSDD